MIFCMLTYSFMGRVYRWDGTKRSQYMIFCMITYSNPTVLKQRAYLSQYMNDGMLIYTITDKGKNMADSLST